MACDFTMLSAYLDGELTPTARQAVEKHLDRCDTCRRELERLERTSTMMQLCLEQPDFHARLIARVAAAEVERRAETRPWRWTRYALVTAAACLLVVWTALNLRNTAPEPNDAAAPVAAVLPQDNSSPPESPVEETVATTDEPPVFAQTEAPEPAPVSASLPMVVTGVMTGAAPSAMITILTTGESGVFGVGEEVVPGVTIVEIAPKTVVVEQDGVRQTLPYGTPPAPDAPPLDGLWKVRAELNGIVVAEDEPMSLTEKDDVVTVQMTINGDARVATAHVTGNYVVFEVVYKDEEYDVRGVVAGTVNDARTEMRLEGKIEQDGQTVAAMCELKKVVEPDALAQVKTGKLTEEVRAMAEALNRYAGDHEGHFPDALDDLVPKYRDDLTLFEDTDNRHVTYSPGMTTGPPVAVAEAGSFEDFMPDAELPSRWMAWEQKLESAWDGQFFEGATLLVVKYTDPAMTYTVDTRYHIVGFLAGAPNPAEGDPESRDALTSCANNLKQLALVCKMFENEQDGLCPPGWLSTYPEYLTDPNILTCPCDPNGTMSYELVFPAISVMNPEGAGVLYEAAHGAPEEEAPEEAIYSTAESRVPLVVETHDHVITGKTGRNVAFADGHVEFVQDSAWSEKVEPYLRLQY